jgi:hypothetical protein
VSKGSKTEEESPPSPEGEVIEPLSVLDRETTKEAIAERE